MIALNAPACRRKGRRDHSAGLVCDCQRGDYQERHQDATTGNRVRETELSHEALLKGAIACLASVMDDDTCPAETARSIKQRTVRELE